MTVQVWLLLNADHDITEEQVDWQVLCWGFAEKASSCDPEQNAAQELPAELTWTVPNQFTRS